MAWLCNYIPHNNVFFYVLDICFLPHSIHFIDTLWTHCSRPTWICTQGIPHKVCIHIVVFYNDMIRSFVLVHSCGSFAHTPRLSKAAIRNYIPQVLWNVITCPRPWYLLVPALDTLVQSACTKSRQSNTTGKSVYELLLYQTLQCMCRDWTRVGNGHVSKHLLIVLQTWTRALDLTNMLRVKDLVKTQLWW